MDDLVRWYGVQLDEDARIATSATDGPWTRWQGGRMHGLGDLLHPVLTPGQTPGVKATIVTASWLDADHIAEWDPKRALREIDAKRQVIAKYTEAVEQIAELASLCERLKANRKDTLMAEMDQMTAIHRRDALYEVLQLHARAYEARPGYLEKWRP